MGDPLVGSTIGCDAAVYLPGGPAPHKSPTRARNASARRKITQSATPRPNAIRAKVSMSPLRSSQYRFPGWHWPGVREVAHHLLRGVLTSDRQLLDPGRHEARSAGPSWNF